MELIKFKEVALVILLSIFSMSSYGSIAAGHVSGKITNITSDTQGLLIRIETDEVPLNCTSSEAWMQVNQDHKAMTSMLITAWTLGRNVSVYTSPGTTGFCQVWQVDPDE